MPYHCNKCTIENTIKAEEALKKMMKKVNKMTLAEQKTDIRNALFQEIRDKYLNIYRFCERHPEIEISYRHMYRIIETCKVDIISNKLLEQIANALGYDIEFNLVKRQIVDLD